MADTPQDVNDDPVMAELSADDTQESPVTESSTEETKTPEVADDSKESESNSETEADESKDESSEETKEEDQPQGKAEERKQQLNTEIRDLVAQRNALKNEVERINNQVYQVATEQELMQDGMSSVEAKVEAMRQQQEIERYTNQVAEAQLTLESESSRVLNDFPIFNPQAEDYDQDLAMEAASLLQSNLIIDQNTGQVIGSNVSPYKLYQTLAKAHESAAVKNRLKGQQATEQMLASADVSTSTTPPKPKKDPIAEILASDD